jgi:cytochrome c-type biogenesis protein CcmH
MKKILFLIFLVSFLKIQANEPNKQYYKIYKNIRCLVCQGQSIGDSNSEFAQTIKLVVKEQVDGGKTENEIYSFLISKYGEWIIYKPPFNKNNFLLWVLPYLVLIFGGVIIFTLIKKKKHSKVN